VKAEIGGRTPVVFSEIAVKNSIKTMNEAIRSAGKEHRDAINKAHKESIDVINKKRSDKTKSNNGPGMYDPSKESYDSWSNRFDAWMKSDDNPSKKKYEEELKSKKFDNAKNYIAPYIIIDPLKEKLPFKCTIDNFEGYQRWLIDNELSILKKAAPTINDPRVFTPMGQTHYVNDGEHKYVLLRTSITNYVGSVKKYKLIFEDIADTKKDTRKIPMRFKDYGVDFVTEQIDLMKKNIKFIEGIIDDMDKSTNKDIEVIKTNGVDEKYPNSREVLKDYFANQSNFFKYLQLKTKETVNMINLYEEYTKLLEEATKKS
jgi:hypothetical protein